MTGIGNIFLCVTLPARTLTLIKVLQWAKDELCTQGQLKVGANIQYDLGWLRHEGVVVTGPYHCTHITERLIDDNSWPSLERLSQKYLGDTKKNDALYEWTSIQFGGAITDQGGNIHKAPPELVAPYAIGDVDLPLRFYKKTVGDN